ncbi:hypothetical protein DPX39_070016200 [Trypanosoma brucei equiperdum]|uniref:Uncharacterized protein n=1 Tax=Trypanosoma brucei equiperdum TaxID=630700 RepID=A0A3L6L6C5_9TRYP|nr:hypothetical protein DPX39_070016200 [Trypanosoma brucei equiperdum]
MTKLEANAAVYSHRLRNLDRAIVHRLAGDQIIFGEGIITAYQLLAGDTKLVDLEKKRRGGKKFSAGVAFAANASRERKLPQRKGNCGTGKETPLVEALSLVGKVDAAIAFCEGKLAAIQQLCPSSNTGMHFRQQRSIHEELMPHALGTGRIELLTNDGITNDVPSKPLLSGMSRRPSNYELSPSDFKGECCAPEQIFIEAREDTQFLWLLRCIAEETIQRYVIVSEERIYFTSFVVAAREEVTAVISAATPHYSPSSVLSELNNQTLVAQSQEKLIEEKKKVWVNGNYIKDSSTDSDECSRVVKGSVKTVCVNMESPILYKKHVRLLPFVQTLLYETEATQRTQIERESHVSLELIDAHRQLMIHHITSKSLMVTEEEYMRELIENINDFKLPVEGKVCPKQQKIPIPRSDGTLSSMRDIRSCSSSPYAPATQSTHSCGDTPSHGSTLSSNPSTLAVSRNVKHVTAAHCFTTEQRHILRLQNHGEVPVYICERVEHVKRQQISTRERRAREQLFSCVESGRGDARKMRISALAENSVLNGHTY